MRRIEFSRRLEEASCGSRNGLLNRGSGVRVPAPAPNPHQIRIGICPGRAENKIGPEMGNFRPARTGDFQTGVDTRLPRIANV